MFQATSENEADIDRLIDCLKAVSIGGVVTHEELSEAIGRDIKPRRYLLFRAADRLTAESGIIFESVRGVGYKRLPIDEVHTVGYRTRRTIRRKAGRACGRMSAAVTKANDAPPDAVLKVNREVSTLGLIRSLARGQVAAKAAADATASAPAPVAMVAARLVKALA